MRWDDLFHDLEAQWAAEERRELDSEIADRTRRERATVTLAARLAAHRGIRVRLRLIVGEPVDGTLTDVGADWLLVRAEPRGLDVVVPLAALVAVQGLGSRAGVHDPARRFGLGYALRGLSRDRATVALTDTTGVAATGTIDGVGADHLDLAEHAVGEARRAGSLTGRRLVPFAAIVRVTSVR